VHYIRGGGMLIRTTFGDPKAGQFGSLLIDTTMDLPLALDERGWKKAGKELKSLVPLPGSKTLTQGVVDMMAFGSLEVPGIPAVAGVPISDIEKPLDLDLDGIVGSGLVLLFRVTLADRGRTMWLEPLPVLPPEPTEPNPAAAPAPSATPAPDPKAAVPPRKGTGAKGTKPATKAPAAKAAAAKASSNPSK
jgi:hypothetical protein